MRKEGILEITEKIIPEDIKMKTLFVVLANSHAHVIRDWEREREQ